MGWTMFQRKFNASFIAFLVLVMLVSAGCPSFVKFTEKVAAENAHFVNAVIIAHKDGFVDDATERTLLTASKGIAKYDDAAVDAYAAQNKPGALAQIDQALATVDGDLANGLLGIKNADKKLELQAIVAGVRSLLITAKAYVQGAK